MRLLLRYLLMGLFSIYGLKASFAQINPIKTATEIGKNLPSKREKPEDSSNSSSTTTAGSNTTSSAPTLDPAAESSPAKSFIASFWKAIEKLKSASETKQYHLFHSSITSAETHLRNITMRDPAYNTKPLQTELEKYKAEYQSNQDRKEGVRTNISQSMDFLNDVFKGTLTTVPYTGDTEADFATHKSKLAAFKIKVDEFLAGTPDQSTLKNWENHINVKASGVPDEVKKYEQSLNAHTSKEGLMIHREILALEAHWDGVVRMYPQMASPKTAQQNIKAALARLGTEKQLLAKFEQNLAEKIKNARMPIAVASNTSIDAEFKKAFANMGWGETILKVNLLSNDWSTLYHSITGNIIARSYRAAIGAKQPNGNCIIYDFTIVQEHTGAGKYGASKRYEHGVFADQCLCENIH